MNTRRFNATDLTRGGGFNIGLALSGDVLRRRLERVFVHEGWGSEVIESVHCPAPCDVLVMDAERLPQVKSSTPAVVVASESMTSLGGDHKANVRALMDQEDLDASFVAAVREVSTGNGWVSPTLARSLINSSMGSLNTEPMENNAEGLEGKAWAGTRTHVNLTTREIEVAALATQGLNNGEIAASLFIAESTVKFHMSNVLRKTGFRDRGQLAAHTA
ncbi:response regulator transcription factor [Streptomyces sp. NPDC048442]|uniref:response regulator transcription factor n=1 Tax=Streptomyces sp. NPDC048442 TaxID=3154823 RepID=UPI0034493705